MPDRSGSYVRSALFVDFDNVYSNLNGVDQAAGEAFATDPERWLRWMQEDMGHVVPGVVEGVGREILVRACYLNPVMFGRYRTFFTNAAFRVIDCPPMTTHGKNSADIHMVLDILDALEHPTGFDEFILLSADADFTPVMLRLRAHDRRTVLLATGPSARSLRSASDMVLPLEVFLNEALDIDLEQGGAVRPVGPDPQSEVIGRPAAVAVPGRFSDGISPPDERSSARLRQLMREEVVRVVAAAQAPVVMAAAAQRIRNRLGTVVLQSGWGSHGSFGAFVQAITDSTLQISGPHPPGYLIDPRRHEPLEPQAPRVPLPDDVADLARRVSSIVGVPQLTSEDYRTLFEEIARLPEDGPVIDPLTVVERGLRDACHERGARVPRSA